MTSSPHHHSHEHTAEGKVSTEGPSPADEKALAQLDRLIAFLDAHFGSIELLAPTAALAAQLFAVKEEDKPETREEGEFDTTPKAEDSEDTAMMTNTQLANGQNAANGSSGVPTSSVPILKFSVDGKDVFIPVDSMVSRLLNSIAVGH